MKKFAILPILALALAAVSCDEEMGTGVPVVNPELPAVGDDQVTVSAASDASAAAVLADYYDKGLNVPVAALAEGENWPEGYTFGVKAYVSPTEDFAKAYEVPAAVVEKTVELKPFELQQVIYENVTKAPVEVALWVRFNVMAMKGNQSITLGGPEKYYGPVKMLARTFDPERVLDSKYYFAWSADGTTWTTQNAMEFTHSDINVYDDPKFSITLNFDGATVGSGMFWKIIPGATFDSGDLLSGTTVGVDPANENINKGALVEGTTTEAGIYTITGPALFNFNIEDMTFDYIVAIPNFWLAGDYVNGTSWNNGEFAKVMWTDNYTDYVGFAHVGSMFKFSPVNGWNGDFGVKDAVEYNTNDNGVTVGTGKADGGNNINVPEDALYYIQLNYNTRALTLTKINTIGIIGGFNDWGNSNAMNPSEDLLTWTITQDMKAGDEWKIRANNGWDISLGGQFDNLWPFNGGNFVCAETGTYDITLNLGTLPWTATVVKK